MSNDFTARINKRADNLEENMNLVVRRVALAIDQTLVLATPVDTGRARSNWQVSLGTPAAGTIDAYAPGENLGRSEGANARAALEQGKAVIGARKPGQTINITNNLPYIGRLNDGHSAQAPAGFVEKAVLTAIRAVGGVTLLSTPRKE